MNQQTATVTIEMTAEQAYLYARDILKGPFPAGKAAIAKDTYYAYLYARFVLDGPFPAGEPSIAKDTYYAYLYARDVLKGQPWSTGPQPIKLFTS